MPTTAARPDAEPIAGTLRKAGLADVQVREHMDAEQQTHHRVRVGKLAARSGLEPLQERLRWRPRTSGRAFTAGHGPGNHRVGAAQHPPLQLANWRSTRRR